MEQPTTDQPLHWDQHRRTVSLVLILAVALAIYGLVFVGDLIMVVLALGVAAFSWLTSPRQYLIYPDALVIAYGRPRVKVIPFARVSHIELLSLPIGDRLRVRLVHGRAELVAARDSQTFGEQLDAALEEFHRSHPEEETGEDYFQA